MNNYLTIFQGILSTEGTFVDMFLDGLDDHGQFHAQNNEEAALVQHISSLLISPTTRSLGLRVLNKFIDNCSTDTLESKGNLWTILVLKAFSDKEAHGDAYLIFHVLNKIIKSSPQIPDLAKSFGSTHISKVYDILTNVPSFKSKYALNCIQTCLRMYPGSSGPSRGTIQRFLWKNVDQIDYEVVENCGKCLHLLLQVKGGQIQDHKKQWQLYQLQLLGGIHSVYNRMFESCTEMYEEKIEQEKVPWETDLVEFDPEPVKKAAQMYTRCRNLITYLSIALREPFPVEKPIFIKKILNIIIRGLSVNCLMLERNTNADNIALSILLPKLHIDLLGLLSVAVTILRGHFRPYFELILGLFVDEIKWTTVKKAGGNQKSFWSLRKKVYDSISLWCKIYNSGSGCETISEYLFKEILNDITPENNGIALQVLSGARKHMSKKARRLLQKAKNEKSSLAKTYCEINNRKLYFSENKKWNLCIAALSCFHEIIFSAANFLKPTILKMMHTSITQIFAVFYELTQKQTHLYNNENCRIEMYNALYAILINTHHLCPPPTELILAIIQTAYARDDSLKVRLRCGFILKNLEKIIHPQKESLLFTIDSRDIRNTFIKMGQENLLREFQLGLSNSSFINYTSDNDEVLESSISTNLNTSLTSIEIKDDSNQIHTDNISESKEVAVVSAKEYPERQIECINGIEAINHQVVNLESLPVEVVNNETLSVESHANIDDLLKSSGLIVCVEDNVDNATENTQKHDVKTTCNTDEPITKKQKLHNEHDTDSRESSNILNNLDHEEKNIIAEIASQFIDELE